MGTLVSAFAAFAVLNTPLLAIRGRSREYALLQLIGASRRQVRRMKQVESPLLLLVGWTVGSAVAAATLMPFVYVVTVSFLPSFPPPLVGGALLCTSPVLPQRPDHRHLGEIGGLQPPRPLETTRPVEAGLGSDDVGENQIPYGGVQTAPADEQEGARPARASCEAPGRPAPSRQCERSDGRSSCRTCPLLWAHA